VKKDIERGHSSQQEKWFVGLACLPTSQGKDIVFRFIIEYSSLRDFYRPLGHNNNNNNNNNRSIFI
jgi:hypothetical protein